MFVQKRFSNKKNLSEIQMEIQMERPYFWQRREVAKVMSNRRESTRKLLKKTA